MGREEEDGTMSGLLHAMCVASSDHRLSWKGESCLFISEVPQHSREGGPPSLGLCVYVTQRMWECDCHTWGWVWVWGFCGMASQSMESSMSFHFCLNVGICVILCLR